MDTKDKLKGELVRICQYFQTNEYFFKLNQGLRGKYEEIFIKKSSELPQVTPGGKKKLFNKDLYKNKKKQNKLELEKNNLTNNSLLSNQENSDLVINNSENNIDNKNVSELSNSNK